MWKSLYVSEGDLLCWVDADIRNFRATSSARLLAPLLNDPDVGMVKGYYRRPLHGEPRGGGRVTELMARPVLSYLFPVLTRFVQPLSGEYAARRSLVETVPFVEGWGVEIGLLLDVVFRFGVQSVTQVDLGVREHRNRPLDELGPQALAILATALRRAGFDCTDPPFVAELVRYDDQLAAERIPVEVQRAAADDHRARVPRQVRPRADRLTDAPELRIAKFRSASQSVPLRARPLRPAAPRGRTPPPICHTRSVSGSSCTSPSTDSSSRPSGVDLTRDDCTLRAPPRPPPSRARRRRPCPRSWSASRRPLAGDDEVDALERAVEPGGVGDDVEAGLELGADGRQPTGEPAGRAAALEDRDVDAGAMLVLVRETGEPAGEQRHLRRGRALLGPVHRGGVEERGRDVARRP